MKKLIILSIVALSLSSFARSSDVISMKEIGEKVCQFTNKGHYRWCLERVLSYSLDEDDTVLDFISLGCGRAVNIGKENCFKAVLQETSMIPPSTLKKLQAYLMAKVDYDGVWRTKCEYYDDVTACYMREIENFQWASRVFGVSLEMPRVIKH